MWEIEKVQNREINWCLKFMVRLDKLLFYFTSMNFKGQ